MTPTPALAVVLVAYNHAAELGETLAALVPQLGAADELLVVDNASTDGTAAAVHDGFPRATVIETGANLGFTGGCRAGATATGAPLLFFLNPDARPLDGCLDALRAAAGEHPDWGAWQALVLHAGGERVNADGGVTHYLGFGWAGHYDEPLAARPAEPREVSFASGAALVVRRAAWDAVGGFDPDYFMYGEDLALGLQLWLAGWRVGVVPAAHVEHEYEFHKGDYKWFLLERNRLRTVLVTYPRPLLIALAPALAAFELALLPVAAAGGWLPAKLRAQAALARELPALLARRRRVQRTRAVSADAFAEQLTAALDSPYLSAARRVPLVVRWQARYWDAVRVLLRTRS